MPNSVHFVRVTGHFAKLFNIARGFYKDIIPCWRGKGHVDARRATLQPGVWSMYLESLGGVSLSSLRAFFYEYINNWPYYF